MCGIDEDLIVIRNGYSAKEVIQALTLENVKNFLYSLGVTEINEFEDYLVCPTICHNPLDEANNMKLYYYDKNKSFHCYTQCSENFNIIELYKRYMTLNHYSINFFEALDYVRQFISTDININPLPIKKKNNLNIIKNNFIELPSLDENILNCFIKFYHPLWLADGISKAAMDKFKIGFSIQQNKITIPHYDINGNLVGIRARAIEEQDIEYGKYMPIKIGDTLYNHQLGFNLYGIYEHKDIIKKTKRAVIFEAEKSVMLSETLYPGYSNAVATCGSQLNKFQINLLVKKLGVNEIILCYDKEYKDLSDPKSKIYREKLLNKCLKYKGLAQFYYVYDEHNLLNEKDSPIDRGQEIYEKLLERKIKV